MSSCVKRRLGATGVSPYFCSGINHLENGRDFVRGSMNGSLFKFKTHNHARTYQPVESFYRHCRNNLVKRPLPVLHVIFLFTILIYGAFVFPFLVDTRFTITC